MKWLLAAALLVVGCAKKEPPAEDPILLIKNEITGEIDTYLPYGKTAPEIPPIESNRLADLKHRDGYIDDEALEFKTTFWSDTEINRFEGDQMPPKYQELTTEWVTFLGTGINLKDGCGVEYGLRSDGVVVWRKMEVK